MKRALLILMLLACLPQAWAAEGEPPVEVSADRLEGSRADGVAHFIGHVQVIRGSQTLSADEMWISYAEQTRQVATIRAVGTPAKVVEVRPAPSPLRTLSADEIVYDVAAETLTATGNARLEEGEDFAVGHSIVLDRKADSSVMEGGGDDGKVHMRFTPKEGGSDER